MQIPLRSICTGYLQRSAMQYKLLAKLLMLDKPQYKWQESF